MKKIFFSLLMLMGITGVQAQEYEYVPLVREGVQRVYLYDKGHNEADVYVYYTEEMCGETTINGIQFKNLYRYFGEALDVNTVKPYAYVREADKKVYAVLDEENKVVDFNVNENAYPLIQSENYETFGEYLIYDFNDFVAFYDENCRFKIQSIGEETVGDVMRKAYYLNEAKTGLILESVGSVTGGGLLFPFENRWVNGNYPTTKGLSHVIENGVIVYKSPRYDEMRELVTPTAITDLGVNETTNGDNRYYNLMGQPVADPTEPGIYIHQGKKIVIK